MRSRSYSARQAVRWIQVAVGTALVIVCVFLASRIGYPVRRAVMLAVGMSMGLLLINSGLARIAVERRFASHDRRIKELEDRLAGGKARDCSGGHA